MKLEFYKNKNITDAIAIARDTNRRFPDDAEGMGVLGACLRANGDYEESLYFLNNAIELNPKYTEALINRGFIKLNQKNKIDALKDLEQAHKSKPHIKQIWELIIGLKIELEQFSDAISLLTNIIEMDPKNEKWHQEKANCHHRLHQYLKAEEIQNGYTTQPQSCRNL